MFHNFLHLTNIFRIIIFGVVFYGTVWSLQYKRFPAKTFQSIFTWPQNITPNFSQLFAANWASILKSRSHLHSSLIVFYHDIEKLKSVLKAKSSHLIFIFKWMQYLKKSLLSCDEIFAAAVCFFLFYFMNCLLIFVELNHIKKAHGAQWRENWIWRRLEKCTAACSLWIYMLADLRGLSGKSGISLGPFSL